MNPRDSLGGKSLSLRFGLVTGQGQTSFGPWTASGVTAGRASEIFNAGTGGAAVNSRTWVSNDLTTIIADAGLASNFTVYDLSAMLAAGTSGAGRLTDFDLRLLIGPDAASALTLASLSDSAVGGSTGKGAFNRQFLLSHTTGSVNPGDRLFIEIEHLENDFFLVVDDVALWSAAVPEPGTFLIWGVGTLLLGMVSSRRRRKA